MHVFILNDIAYLTVCLLFFNLFVKNTENVHELSKTETIQVSQELSHKLNNLLWYLIG